MAREGGAGVGSHAWCPAGRWGWNHLERFFAGRARTEGGWERDAMTTFGGFPGNQGCHGNCITPVRIGDFRWKACSPL